MWSRSGYGIFVQPYPPIRRKVTISVVIFLVGIFIMAVVFWVLLAREKTVIDELERKADEAMYQNKSEYYARTGKDRRRR